MNEIGLIRILYKYRIRLLIITLAVGVLAAAITLLISNKYSASAAISVQQPEIAITGEIPPLSVESLRSLIESTQVKWELFQELNASGNLVEGISFPRFQEMLSTSVERDVSREKNLLPMVKLTATTSVPDLSMEIANRWAEVVLKKTREIYQSSVDELSTFTTNIYEKVSKSLLESEDRYTEMMLKSNLTVNKMLLEHNKALYSQLSQEVLKLQDEVAVKKVLLENLKVSLSAQEIDGIWIGEVYDREYSESPEYVLPVSTPLIDRIARTIRSLKENQQALTAFEESSRLDYKNMMVKIKKKQIEDISQEVLLARTQLFSAEPTYNKLQEELAGLEPKIILTKAIGDDAIWNKYLQGDLPESGSLPGMKSEESNTVFLETKKEMIRLAGEVSGLKNKIGEGKQELETLRKEVSDLMMDIAPLETKRGTLQRTIKKDRDLLTYYENTYNADRQGYEAAEKDLEQMEVRLAAEKTKLDSVGKELVGLEKSVYVVQDEIARQKRDVENLAQVRSSLAAKAEEVELLRVSIENVSRSGTVLLYKAQADPVKVGPRRTRIILIAMLMAFALACLLVVLNTLVKEGTPG